MPHTTLGIIESPPLSLFGGGIHLRISQVVLTNDFLVFCSLTCDNYPPSFTSASTKSLLNKTQKKKTNKLELELKLLSGLSLIMVLRSTH